MKIIFDPDAQSEFFDAIQYYEESKKGLGKRYRIHIEFAIKSISEAPFRYRTLHHPFRKFLLKKFPYSIIYTIEPDHIRIMAVAHTKRKPGYWLNRKK